MNTIAPTLFLIYINDLLSITQSSINSYADDSTLHTVVPRKGSGVSTRRLAATSINDDLSSIVSWGKSNHINFNASKTHLMLISSRRDVNDFPELSMSNSTLSRESSMHMLGLSFSSNLSWCSHIRSIARSAACKLGFLNRSKRFFTPDQRLTLYKAQVRPLMEYCCHVWGGAPQSHLSILDRLQKKAIRIIDDPELTCSLISLQHRRFVSCLSFFYRYYFFSVI